MAENTQPTAPKKRGRKPGSKNKVKSKRGSKQSSYLQLFADLEKEIASLANALQSAQVKASKEIEKMEAKFKKVAEAQKDKAFSSVKLWKNRAKDYRKRMLAAGKGKRKVKVKVIVQKPAGKRGRPSKLVLEPRKGGGRKRAGELTKKDVILNFMREYKNPITSKDLIDKLFAASGEKDRKRYSQGIYTTLTQIYKTGELVNRNGMITVK